LKIFKFFDLGYSRAICETASSLVNGKFSNKNVQSFELKDSGILADSVGVK
jgi:hypothetical protein